MKITAIQTDIKWQEVSINQINAEKLILDAIGSDVYVLPEMWPTGFIMHPENIAETESESNRDGSFAWMKNLAKKTNAAICGSLAIKTCNGKYVNRMYFVRPDGSFCSYDKRHLFVPGGESKFYSAGTQRTVVEFRGVKFMLAVCYDIRFPVWLRNNNEYDVLICSANWPASRHEVWQTLLKARAIENQCYVIGVNRTGLDPQCKYNGGSCFVSPYGKIIEDCGNAVRTITETIDMNFLNTFRLSFQVLNDRDKFEIIN